MAAVEEERAWRKQPIETNHLVGVSRLVDPTLQ